MSVIELLAAPFINYWFIALPELAYLLFFGLRFFGPFAVLAWPLYSAVLIAFPVPVMAAVGTVMAVHAVFIVAKNFIGDRIAGIKKADVDKGMNGVPRMSGPDKCIQDDLDWMKEPHGQILPERRQDREMSERPKDLEMSEPPQGSDREKNSNL